MARTISDKIWSDDWFAEQEPVGKLIWIGILTKVADDQGRFRQNADLVKSLIFPMSKEPTAEQIDTWLAWFITCGKVIAYEANGRKLCQVKNWWKYQGGANWMTESEYPAPQNWNDWYKYQGRGGKLVSSEQRGGAPKHKAGFVDTLEATLQDPLEATHEGRYINDNDNDKVKDNTGAPAPFGGSKTRQKAVSILTEVSRLATVPVKEMGHLETVCNLIDTYGEEQTRNALQACFNRWVTTPGKNGRTYSPINFGWVDWAIADISGQSPEEPAPLPDMTAPDPREAEYIPAPEWMQRGRK